MIGLVSPPYGLLLFMMTKIANVGLSSWCARCCPSWQ
jgi:TRAP-type C4-dicarboxylate transport system permease large subunit